jgi:creatinine amidohydrolase
VNEETPDMKDALNTSSEIAQSEIDLAIVPIGATEQHGAYLPLATDSLEAEAVAKGVAERLNAFLLPVLPFSNSEAHTGFRGSVSLTRLHCWPWSRNWRWI